MQQGYGIHLPKLTPLNKILIIITASSFFLQSILAKTGAAFVLNYVPNMFPQIEFESMNRIWL